MAISTYLIIYYIEKDVIKLFVGAFIAVPLYFGLIKLFKIQELNLIITKTKALIK